MQESRYAAGRSAGFANRSLKSSLTLLARARHNAVLWYAEIHRRRLFEELGYSSMRHYATGELGFSPSRCTLFNRLAERLEDLPVLRRSLTEGRIGYSKAEEVLKVAGPDSEAGWVQRAENSTRQELRQAVKRAKARARRGIESPPGEPEDEGPVRVGLEMSRLQFARFEALLEALRKQGRPGDRADLVLEGLSALVDSDAQAGGRDDRRRAIRPSAPPATIHVHVCPECARSVVQTGRGEMALDETAAEQVACDATIDVPGNPNRRTIPPRTREAALARARHRCESPGCDHTRFLEVHHIVPRVLGGKNELSNLKVLCSACHRFHHLRNSNAPPPTASITPARAVAEGRSR